MENSNHSYICWKNNPAGHEQSRRSLECIYNNFLRQMTENLKRLGTLLDLILINKGELVEDPRTEQP